MKQFKFTLLLVAAFSVLMTSCDTGPGIKYIQKNKALILNQGNYLSQDASVYVYDEDTKTMTPNAFARANNNTRLGATLMSGTYSNYGIGYLLCSQPDKIEVINVLTMKTLTNPIKTNLMNTREIALDYEYIYVTNAGSDYIELPNGFYEYTKSYVSIYNQANNNPVDTVHVGSDAQGLVFANNAVYVGTKAGIVKLVKDGSSITKEDVYTDTEYTGAVKYLCYYNNTIYATVPGYGILAYDPSSDRVLKRYSVPEIIGFDGYMTMDMEGNLYTFATNYAEQSSVVYKFNPVTEEVSQIFEGENLNSLGVSPYSGNIFTSEANGFQTNSTIYITNPKQPLANEMTTGGVGTFRYLFFTYYEEDKSEGEKK